MSTYSSTRHNTNKKHNIHHTFFIGHQPAIAVCMPTPINTLLNDESNEVQIIFLDVYT